VGVLVLRIDIETFMEPLRRLCVSVQLIQRLTTKTDELYGGLPHKHQGLEARKCPLRKAQAKREQAQMHHSETILGREPHSFGKAPQALAVVP
jgi:hypothetical protein